MTKKKNMIIIIAVVLQCLILSAICFQRESILSSGDIVYMRTAPVDPRDLFRGDYVQLGYEASSLPKNLITEDLQEKMGSATRVYVIYETDDRKVLIPQKVSVEKPSDEETFIRAYTDGRMRWDTSVRYGIEKYFMEMGQGRKLETGKTLKGIRIPLEMEVAIGKGNGIAVLKGYRYAEMGMNIETPKPRSRKGNESFCLTVKMINATDRPLAIVHPADNRTFVLEFVSLRNKKERIEIKAMEHKPYAQSDIKVIAPATVHEIKINLNSPSYQLLKNGKELSWKDLTGYQSARIRYVSPAPEMLQGLNGAESLWKGTLFSRNFTRYDFSN